MEADVLRTARTCAGGLEIDKWFNAKVKEEMIGLSWPTEKVNF